jgi:hypothetical protein
MSLPFNKLRVFGKQILNHLKDEIGDNNVILTNPTKIFKLIKSDELLTLLTSRLSESDTYKVVFITTLLYKNVDISKIESMIANNLLTYELINYDEPDTVTETCDECDGYGREDCDNCNRNGTVDCYSCDGSGDEICSDCSGSGEDEEGNACYSCDGDGSNDCSECNGDGYQTCSSCDGNGYIECDYCGGGGEIDSYTEYYNIDKITCITFNTYSLGIEEDKILTDEEIDELMSNDVLFVRSNDSERWEDLIGAQDILDKYSGDFTGTSEDDIYVMTSAPVKL